MQLAIREEHARHPWPHLQDLLDLPRWIIAKDRSVAGHLLGVARCVERIKSKLLVVNRVTHLRLHLAVNDSKVLA